MTGFKALTDKLKRMLRFALLFWSMTGLLLGSSTGVATELQPGLYEIDVLLELPHLREHGEHRTVQKCLTLQQINAHDAFSILTPTPLSTCKRLVHCKSPSHCQFSVHCKGRDGASAKGIFQKSSRSFTGRIKMNMGGKNMIVFETQTGRWLKDCPLKTLD